MIEVYLQNTSNHLDEDILEAFDIGADYLGLHNIQVVADIKPLPDDFGGCYGEDDLWYIEVDSRLDLEQTKRTIFHELVHINQVEVDIDEKERIAEDTSEWIYNLTS